MAQQMAKLKGLDHIKGSAQRNGPGHQIIPAQGGYGDDGGMGSQPSASQLLQQRIAVHPGHKHIGNQNIEFFFCRDLQSLRTVVRFADPCASFLAAQILRHGGAVLGLGCDDQNPVLFHAGFLHCSFYSSGRRWEGHASAGFRSLLLHWQNGIFCVSS